MSNEARASGSRSVFRWVVASLVAINVALFAFLLSCRHYAKAGQINPHLSFVVPDGYRGPLFLDTRGATSKSGKRIEVVFDGTGYAHVPAAKNGYVVASMQFAGSKRLAPYEEREGPADGGGVSYHLRDWASEELLVHFVGTREELRQFEAAGGGYQRVAKILAKPPKSR